MKWYVILSNPFSTPVEITCSFYPLSVNVVYHIDMLNHNHIPGINPIWL